MYKQRTPDGVGNTYSYSPRARTASGEHKHPCNLSSAIQILKIKTQHHSNWHRSTRRTHSILSTESQSHAIRKMTKQRTSKTTQRRPERQTQPCLTRPPDFPYTHTHYSNIQQVKPRSTHSKTSRPQLGSRNKQDFNNTMPVT